MAKDIDNAKRGTQYNADPLDLTLVWEDGKDPRRGPRDLVLAEWPQHQFVRAAFDASIKDPTDMTHVNGMITPLDGGGLVGVLQNVIVRLVPCPKDIAKALKIEAGSDLLVVTAGRSRTKEAREGNRLLAESGASLRIRVPFDTRKMTDQTAELVKGIENLHRKVIKPSEIAHYIETAEAAKTPREKIMMEIGVETWAAVETYKGFGALSPKLQALVDAKTVPLKAAVELGKMHKLHEDQDKHADALSQIAATTQKGKVKGSQVKAVVSGEQPAEKQRNISRAALESALKRLDGHGMLQTDADSRKRIQGAAQTLRFFLNGQVGDGADKTLIELLQAPPAQKKAEKPQDPAAAERAAAAQGVKDNLVKNKWPIRYALMISLRRWEKEGTTDNPAEFCVSEKWYSRMVEAFNAYYRATLEKTPADKHSPAKEAVFAKWLDTLKE